MYGALLTPRTPCLILPAEVQAVLRTGLKGKVQLQLFDVLVTAGGAGLTMPEAARKVLGAGIGGQVYAELRTSFGSTITTAGMRQVVMPGKYVGQCNASKGAVLAWVLQVAG